MIPGVVCDGKAGCQPCVLEQLDVMPAARVADGMLFKCYVYLFARSETEDQ
jgi:hypothetical protein